MKFTLSHDLYVHNLKMIRWYASFVGLDIMEPNYRPNVLTFAAGFGTCVLLVGEFYTVWYFWPNLVKIMESAAIYGVVIQGIVKFYTAVRYRKFFESMYNRLDLFHYEHRQHEQNNATLLKLMKRICLLRQYLTLQFCITLGTLALTPAVMYFFKEDTVLIFAVLIPFTDPEKSSHYWINLSLQLYLLVVGTAGFIAAESVLILFVASVAGYANVLKNEVNEMNSLLLDAEHSGNRQSVKAKLLEILLLHQRVLEYETDLEERYYLNNWVQVASIVFNLTGALFGCYVNGSFTMFTIGIAVTIQLFQLCLLGTILSIKNEEIEHAFYNSLWYLMDRSERRIFQIMFHKSQHAVEMTVASMAPLNIVLFISIMRKIYAFAMMLMSFFE